MPNKLINFLDGKDDCIVEKHTKDSSIFGVNVRLDIVKRTFGTPKNTLSVSSRSILEDHWCGYTTFEKRPLFEKWYKGIVQEVPVHGGVTFAEKNEYAMGTFTYGFNCAHGRDILHLAKVETKHKDRFFKWLWGQTHILAMSILIAKDYEKEYLHTKDTHKMELLVGKMLTAVDNAVNNAIDSELKHYRKYPEC